MEHPMFRCLLNAALDATPKNKIGVVFDKDGLCCTEYFRRIAIQRYKKSRSQKDLIMLANCADVITTAFPDHEYTMVSSMPTTGALPIGLNTTSFANIAHVSLYATNKDSKSRAMTILENWIDQYAPHKIE
jgi:hypothetical protein